MIKPVFHRKTVNVPLTGMVRTVADGFEKLRQEHCPVRTNSAIAATGGNAWQGVTTNLLSVVTGQECSASRPASGRVVELRKPQPLLRDRIQIWSGNLAAVTPEIRISQVVGHDEQDVRFRCGFGNETTENQSEQNETGELFHGGS